MTKPHDAVEEEVLPTTLDEEGRTCSVSTFVPSGTRKCKVLLTELPAVIPVIFLPGIMGTNLKAKEDGKIIWRPPNVTFRPDDILKGIGALFTWWFRDSKQRQEMLSGDMVEVDDQGSISVGNSGISKRVARRRGWGTVMRSAYAPIMATLQERLNKISELGQALDWWASEGQRDPADYGEILRCNPPLTQEELNKASRYRYDVWCGGYNWLNSNQQSAEDIKAWIEETVFAYYRQQPEYADQVNNMKVILVTHSMGGLVARALNSLSGYGEKILGMVSGVQPATGAPATYHHMRCGYTGPVQVILGRNAGQVTAVCGRSAGALELLPSFDHNKGRPWLWAQKGLQWKDSGSHEVAQSAPDADGSYRLTEASPLPQRGMNGNADPYEQIYRSREWYGLVPRQNERYLNLVGSDGDENGGRLELRDEFDLLINDVRDFHCKIYAKYVNPTYAHYGADGGRHSWRDIVWLGDYEKITAIPGQELQDDGNGSYRHGAGARDAPELTKVPGAGDGTVCDRSGSAPEGKEEVKASFRQGEDQSGQYNHARPGYKHQPSYNDKHGRTQWATLYGIVKIVQQADWCPAEE